ncbi:MAG TPA: hypothetical protein VMR25_13105 [Planctomycetaceae bacterium]|nr:hypothetical protein [Planctomycetaceae bacterium]
MNKQRVAVVCLSVLLIGTTQLARADDVDTRIAAIAAVGSQGTGSAEARKACHELSRQGPEILPALLSAMDTPNIVAANWYRAAYERIVARELAHSSPTFPVEGFKACVRDSRRQGRARRLALDLLDRIEPSFKQALLPTLLDDPEFRDDAVSVVLKEGDASQTRGERKAAKVAYEKSFQHARNAAQVTAAAQKLESLGEKVSIANHLGFVTEWSLIGPFAAPGMTGYRTPFPPEASVDLAAVTATADRKVLRWTHHRTSDPFGTVDLVSVLGPVNEAVGYAYTEIESPGNREAQLRSSADDCLAVWLNGQKVFGREMWLNGTRFDRFITPVRLKAGSNRLLVKICQGPHHRDPAVGNAWTFQLRLCSPDGEGLGLKSALSADKQSITSRSKSSVPDK